MSKWIANTGTKPNTQGKPFEVRLRNGVTLQPSEESEVNLGNGFDWSLEDSPNDGDILEWRFVEPVKASGLTQAEVQSLLNIVRGELAFETNTKEVYKTLAANEWVKCAKDDPSTEVFFKLHSYARGTSAEAKQKEKKLVALITKLKGLR